MGLSEDEITTFLEESRKDLLKSIHIHSLLDNKGKEHELFRKQRTGIYKGIMNYKVSKKTEFIFKYIGSNDRKERWYLFKKIENTNQFLLFTLSPRIWEKDNAVKNILEIGEKFLENLRNLDLIKYTLIKEVMKIMSKEKYAQLQKLFEKSQEKVAQKLREQIGAKVEIIQGKPTSENYSYIPRVESSYSK